MPPTNKDLHTEIRGVAQKLEKHLDESVTLHSSLSALMTDMSWVKKGMWIVIAAAVGQVGVQLFK